MAHQQRERRRPAGAGKRPPRCRPTLHARFVDGQLVELEHRHVARNQPSEAPRPAKYEDQPRRLTSPTPIDPGCSGPCVGRRQQLPLDYLDVWGDE